MGTQENKAVVSRWMNEVLAKANVDMADDVLAPDYVNVAAGNADRAGVKETITATAGLMKDQRFEDVELVGEGDAVFARFNYSFTLPDGSRTTCRTMAYYRLADGKIVVNDVMSVPDMFHVLGPYMAPPSGAHP
jgi:predicted SnoaL-like aldol condensation-catalyzing enzyme